MTFNEIIPGLLAGKLYKRGDDERYHIFIGPFSLESDVEVLRVFDAKKDIIRNYVLKREDFWRRDWNEYIIPSFYSEQEATHKK